MKFIKEFESFVNEELTAPAPARPRPGTPTRPERPEEEPTITPIETPVVDPDPMAHGLAKKFIKDLSKKGITPKKYKK
jgi:hypothetical protein